MSLLGCKSNIYKSRFKTGYKFVQRNRWAGGSSLSPLIFIRGSRDKCKRGECRRGKQWGNTREDAARTPARAGAEVSVPRAVDGLEKGAEIKGREMAPRHPVRNEGCLHLHRQPPPLAGEDSTAQQLGGSPNTLGITLQQQHLFSQEQEAGGDASFYSFYAVLHHTKSSRDHLAQRITLCHKSLIPLKRAAAPEEMVAHVSCIYCNASSWATAGGSPHRAEEPSSPC